MGKSRFCLFFFLRLKSTHGRLSANDIDVVIKGPAKNLTKKQARWHIIMLLQIHDPLGILKKNGIKYKGGTGIVYLQSHRDMSVHNPVRD